MMPAVGDKISVLLYGHPAELEIEERVRPDASCYQYDSGWWAYDAAEIQYFISDDGIVYGETPRENDNQLEAFQTEVGKVVN